MKEIEQLVLRMNFLRAFDGYVRNAVGDDIITEYWLTYGLPDCYTYEDLSEIATNDNLWLDAVKAFAHCIHAEIEELEEEEEE